MRTAISLIIADDHDMLRLGLKHFLQTCPDFQLLGEASTGQQVIELMKELQPDIVLMDLKMPHGDGIETTRFIRENYPHTKVVVLTSFDDQELVCRVIQAGASSYLLKTSTPEEIAIAICATYEGQSILANEAVQALVHANTWSTVNHPSLTEREKEVLGLMIVGHTNQDIAQQLVISVSTVKKHVRNVLGKLSANNRTEAVAFAIQQHLLD